MPILESSVPLFLLFLNTLQCPTLGLRNGPAASSLPEKCGPHKFFNLQSGQCGSCSPELIPSPEGLSCVCKPGSKESSGEPPRLPCPGCSSVPPGTLWESDFLDGSFLACENTCNATACQMLTNMVILRAFSLQTRPYDLYTKAKSQDLPKIWYGSDTGPFPSVAFGKHLKTDFKLIQYDVRGKFLGWQEVKGATLQLCPNSQKALDAAFLLGTTYSQSCTLEVSALLQRTPEPIFYEMFLQFEDEKGNTQLWPIPISNPTMAAKVSLPKPSLFQQSVEMQTPKCLQQALSVHASTPVESSAPEILFGRRAIKPKREFVKCSRVCDLGKGFASQIPFCIAVNTNVHCIYLADMSPCWYPKYPCVRSCPEAQEAVFILVASSSSSSPALLPSKPTSILLPGFCSVHLPTTAPGEDPPFSLTVRYATYPLTGVAQVSFSVSYIQRPGSAQLATDIAFGVLGFLAVLYALLETSSWARRSRLQNIGLTTILKFFACLVGSLANVFFMVTLGIGVYWLIAFKGQQFSTVEITLPAAGSQVETNFIIYALGALILKVEKHCWSAFKAGLMGLPRKKIGEDDMVTFVMQIYSSGWLQAAFIVRSKSLDLLHLLITQLTVSIFLIDWEKPKEKSNMKGGPASSVSAWRTFLIANEWNEIQTHRKVHPSLQLFAVLLVLEVVGLKNLASRDLNVSLQPEPNAYQAPWSPILRFGIAASVWLVVAIVQMLLSVGLYQRFVEDKIHQFIDLCSLSNVSVFILTHRCYGFYIHGRSIHGHADVNLDTMLSYLRKEEDNLCPLRGLEANSEVQTFEVLLTDRMRTFYDRILLSLTEHQRGLQSRPDLHELRLKGYHALNWFLVSFLEHRYKDMDYIVKDKFFSERVMDLEFQEPGDLSILYNDDSALFSRTLFYGHELLLLLFETLLFCAVDLGAQNFVLSAVVTFAVQKLVQVARDTLGRRNLAEKTLVEKRFLI